MSDIVIKAENLGKSYLISHQTNGKHDTLRDLIVDKTKGLLSKIHRPQCHTNQNIEENKQAKKIIAEYFKNIQQKPKNFLKKIINGLRQFSVPYTFSAKW